MERLAFNTDEDLADAVTLLRSLGRRARKLLAECVADQVIVRTSISQTASALDDACFIVILDKSGLFESRFEISPSLAGEEALEALELAEEAGTSVSRCLAKGRNR